MEPVDADVMRNPATPPHGIFGVGSKAGKSCVDGNSCAPYRFEAFFRNRILQSMGKRAGCCEHGSQQGPPACVVRESDDAYDCRRPQGPCRYLIRTGKNESAYREYHASNAKHRGRYVPALRRVWMASCFPEILKIFRGENSDTRYASIQNGREHQFRGPQLNYFRPTQAGPGGLRCFGLPGRDQSGVHRADRGSGDCSEISHTVFSQRSPAADLVRPFCSPAGKHQTDTFLLEL